MVGPTVLGRIPWIARKLFPLPSVIVLENMAYLGLIYFTFITGVEIDLISVRRTGHSASFALACTSIPFAIGSLAAVALHSTLNGDADGNLPSFLVFLGVALSVSSFSVLVRTLAELKLLNSTVGATALSASILVDSFAWVLLALAITLAQNDGDPAVTLWTMMSGLGFYGAARVLVRPAADWISSRAPEGGCVDDFAAASMLVGVMVAALVADAIGIHAVLGAFVYGFVIPSDSPVGTALIERLEDFVEGLLLPLFFGISGIKTNLGAVHDVVAAAFLILIVVASAVAKIAGCLLVSYIYRMPLRDGMAIGLLMNTKGVIELVLLNIGRDQQLLSEASFSVLVCTSAIVSAFVSPLLTVAFRYPRRLSSFQRRSVQSGRPESELRLLLCLHATRHVPSMLALLDASNPSKRHPVSALSLHLIELSSRPSSMLIIHSTATTNKNHISSSAAADALPSSSSSAATAAISRAFKSYEENAAGGVSVRTLTAVSPYTTMHQDICAVAQDFRAALVIIPFHKHRTVDGGMEPTNPSLRPLNHSVLASAPCSVAILIDRGLPAPSRLALPRRAALFFLGGPDDREALAFSSRIASHHHFSLSVLRLIHPDRSPEDDDCITEFRLQHVGDDSVSYAEAEAASAEDTVAALRSLVDGRHDLYLVGKAGGGVGSPLTAGLTDWSECPELGPIGDLLASPDFGAPVTSVLVVQQCSAVEMGDSVAAPGKASLGSSRGRFAMMSADKATYRTRSLASRRT